MAERVVLVREQNYKKILRPEAATDKEMGVITALTNGFTMPFGTPSHRNGCYARVIDTAKKEGEPTYLALLTFPYSALDPDPGSKEAAFFLIKEEDVEVVDEKISIDELTDAATIQKKKKLAIIRAGLEQVFPNRWDLNETNAQALIHFPEITISNKADRKHKIRDLFIRLSFVENWSRMNAPHGLRTSKTIDELECGYNHSHLHTGNWRNFENGIFCFGTTPFAETIMRMREGPITEETFAGFLFQLEDYLHWESLDGGPHIKIEVIGANLRAARSSAYELTTDSGDMLEGLRISRSIARKLLDRLTPDFLRFETVKEGLWGRPIVQVDCDNKKLVELVSQAMLDVDKDRKDVSIATAERKFNLTLNSYEAVRTTRTEADIDPKLTTNPRVKEWVNSSQVPIVFKGQPFPFKAILSEEERQREKDLIMTLPPATLFSDVISYLNNWLAQENLIAE